VLGRGTASPLRGAEPKDREDATVLVSVLVSPKLREDLADVSLDRLDLHREMLADGAVRPTLGHVCEHLQLAWGKLVEQVVSNLLCQHMLTL